MKINLLLIAILIFSARVFCQISEVMRLPVKNKSQNITESAPVWLSDSEIMIFYVNETKDTIYSAKSVDKGITWQQEKFITTVSLLDEFQKQLYPTAIITETGRIILAWSILTEGINLIYSDDEGNTWSDVQIILGEGQFQHLNKNLLNVRLSKINNNRIILNFNRGIDHPQSVLYYRISEDNGVSWGDTVYSINREIFYFIEDNTIISNSPNSLICVFKLKHSPLGNNFDIYAKFSFDDGVTWGDTVKIAGSNLNETSPRITMDGNGTLWLAYVREDTIKFSESYYEKFPVGDIFYKSSTNGGLSWSDEKRLTSYIGDDNFLSITANKGEPFITYSTPKFTNTKQIAIGYLNSSVETFTPPALLLSTTTNEPDSLVVLAFVKDDDAMQSVNFSFDNSSKTITLYDDGNHGDREAADDIFGERIPYPPSNYNNQSINILTNKLKIPFKNNGIIAFAYVRDTNNVVYNLSDVDDFSVSFPASVVIQFPSGGKYEEGTFLFSSGFFLSGYSNGELWANAVAPSSLVDDYLPGTEGSNPDDQKFNFYVIRKEDQPFGSSWQRWKDAVELGAEFYDGDGDGFYNPVDKNFNGTWDANEDMPALLGDLTAWCVYNDALPDSLRRWQISPQGIEVRQTVFVSDLPDLENIMFIKYSIQNTGSVATNMDSVYFGVWEDGDLGDYIDDVVGCDTLLNSSFYYNNTPDDIYGDNCPSFFTTYLQGPVIETGTPSDTATIKFGELIGSKSHTGAKNLTMSSHVFYVGGVPDLNDPSNATEARNYMKGKTRIGHYPDPCNFIFTDVRGGVDCSEVNPVFWVSGDPVTDVGWLSTIKADIRNLTSIGPFKLEKDKPQEIIVAYVMGRGTDFFNSITVARDNVRRAILEYQNNFSSLTYQAPPPIPVTSYVLFQNYPNPFNPGTTIRYEIPQDGVVTINIYDILGQKVKTILNEFKQTGRYEIKFNASGLASGVYIYRMKVNNFIESKKMIVLK